ESHDETELARYVRARDAYGAWAASLRETTGIDVGHRKSGALEIARDEASLAKLRTRVEDHRARGLAAEMIDRPTNVERGVAADLAGAAFYPDEAQVDPP